MRSRGLFCYRIKRGIWPIFLYEKIAKGGGGNSSDIVGSLPGAEILSETLARRTTVHGD